MLRPSETPVRQLVCANCSADLVEGANFCSHCGTSRSTGPVAFQARDPVVADRRQVTILFCDVADSTRLAEALDPEVLREIMGGYHTSAAKVVEHYGGRVAQYLGDGLLVYFGYPQAHEDDAVRATRSALEINRVISASNGSLTARGLPELGIRIGIHTGVVVVGEVGDGKRREQLALGVAPNIAARLQDVAPVGGVVIGETTCRLVDGFFTVRSLGRPGLKGISQAIEAFEVVGETGIASRFELASRAGLTPRVARDDELTVLERSLEEADSGQRRAVLIAGDPGVGKSRLVHSFRERLSGRGVARLWGICHCSPFRQASAFSPFLKLVEEMLQLDGATPGQETTVPRETRRAVLDRGLAARGLGDAGDLLASVLSLPVAKDSPIHDLAPHVRRARTVQLFVDLFQPPTSQLPVLAVEDLHWIDPSSMEILRVLITDADRPPFIILTARPSFESPWLDAPDFATLRLGGLGPAQTRMMMASLAGGRSLPREVEQLVVERTDGVPLFVEELVKVILASGLLREEGDCLVLDGDLSGVAIPESLMDSLTARIDRLDSSRELVKTAAAIGRRFSFSLVREVTGLGEGELVSQLGELVQAQLLYQEGEPPSSKYIFKHALIRDAVYASLLLKSRRSLHARIAEVLLDHAPTAAAHQPEEIARHFTEGQRWSEAAEFWLAAGQLAFERSAAVEAADHLNRGLAALAELPEDGERARKELMLRVALSPALVATTGYGTPEIEDNTARALEMCELLGEVGLAFDTAYSTWVACLVHGDVPVTRVQAEGLVERNAKDPDPTRELVSRLAMGVTCYYEGRHRESRDHLLACKALRAGPGCDFTSYATGEDAGVAEHSHLSVPTWFLGYPDRARDLTELSVARSRETGRPYNQAFGLFYSSFIGFLRRDAELVERQARECMELSRSYGMFWEFLAEILLGWAEDQLDPGCVGSLEHIRNGLGIFLSVGGGATATLYRSIEAGVCFGRGDLDGAGAVLAEAFAQAEAKKERFWLPELYRQRAAMVMAREGRPGLAAAQTELRAGIEIARGQEARILELRSATALGWLWADAGRAKQATALVAPLCDSFTEGLELPDFVEARQTRDLS